MNADANPYNAHVMTGAVGVYQEANYNLTAARQDAFSWLAYETKRWSDFRDVIINGNQMIRITVTYIDPELVQYIVLNHVLSHLPGPPADPNLFQNEINQIMNTLGQRNEMLFLVTVTAPDYDSQAFGNNLMVVQIPFEDMTLISATDMRIAQTHDDHILSEPILITRGPVSGYIGFPLAELVGNDCTWLMDNAYTTSLTLEMNSVTVGQTQSSPQSWHIRYQPLAQRSNHPSEMLIGGQAPGFPISQQADDFKFLGEPPRPAWAKPAPNLGENYWQEYWEQMGQFLWFSIILDEQP